MAYQIVLRKYRLPKPEETRYRLMANFRELDEAGNLEEFIIDEFVVNDDKKLSWWGALKKQLAG